MIDAVEFRNFRALRNVDLELGPLTVLVGPNGCGKTSVLEGLEGDEQSLAFHRQDLTFGEKAARVSVRQHHELLNRRRHGSSGGAWWKGRATRHAWRPAKIRDERMASRQETLDRTGSNLAGVINSMSSRARAELSRQFAELVPSFVDVGAVPGQNEGRIRLAFYDRWSDTELHPDQVSDGSLLALALVTLAHQPERPDLVGIEEPENGLHPYLIRKIMEIIVSLTQGDAPLQIILTTHSPVVLDCVPAESVRFMRRNDDGDVIVETAPTGTDDWATYLQTFDDRLGDAWLSGGLGGVSGLR